MADPHEYVESMKMQDSKTENRSVLKTLSFLEFLPPDLRTLVVDSFVPVSLPYGSIIVEEGQEGDALYVLRTGRARVVKQDEAGRETVLKMLGPGDYFGEIGLLQGGKSTATVQACDNVETFRLAKFIFSNLLQKVPELRLHFERHAEQKALQDFFRLRSPFSKIPAEALTIMLNAVEKVTAEEGQLIIRQGDDPGPMYVVQEGRMRVFVEKEGCREVMRSLQPGDVFGAISIWKHTKRTATVQALCSCTLLSLRPETFWKLVNNFPEFKWQVENTLCSHGCVPS